MNESVNHPSHYKLADGRDLQDIFWDYSEEGTAYFCIYNAVKYGFRAGKKDIAPEDQDLKKKDWYIHNCAEHTGLPEDKIRKLVDSLIANANTVHPIEEDCQIREGTLAAMEKTAEGATKVGEL